ncbi:alpha/beta fold hydrolase [Mycolicibacterium sp. P9-64]|uniref:alpha/beta hydrolase fold domain-containing protein n=1 Tax=Mycolicibacterium sp. P9-64 TaxID=2024612 RepID=UPI0011EC5FD9|nr:alpha/beta hydrolase fold domain-containing protein [Mycolicibacterium sp. P9-64]KAA0074256.1 alpha/beta fold hydrolase [Mycolicibacterium sp. P9-64]
MATPTVNVTLPGRLGDPELELQSDPRTDPRLVAAFTPLGLGGAAATLPVDRQSPLPELLAVAAATEQAFATVFSVLLADVKPAEGVETSTETITGVDGNDITLYIDRPAGATAPLPGLLHLHGGGMAILQTSVAKSWREALAAAGCVVVGVEFRNSGGELGPHPFPAGLNDCSSALDWMHARRDELGLASIVVTGESGGGNLSLATALKARREGRLDRIDGVYAQVPYIFGGYDTPDPALPSLIENDGYILTSSVMTLMATLYDPVGEHTTNPLAWPYYAEAADLEGLPPHVITTDELDPLRDEGLAYLRALQRAGVEATGHTYSGVGHACELLAAAAIPELFERALRDVVDFAHRVM